MTELTNIYALKTYSPIPSAGTPVYIKGHTTAGDGGGGIFIWRTESVFIGTGMYNQNNDGTIIKINNNDTGRWVRQYDGYINVQYFGVAGTGGEYSAAFQNALDFAFLNTSDVGLLKSSTLFIPNGSYRFSSSFVLKNGISILGESMEKTIIYCVGGVTGQYLFNIDSNPVIINVSNLYIEGQDPIANPNNPNVYDHTEKGCFYLKASAPTTNPKDDGGLWHSRFTNIRINGLKGHGIYSQAGVNWYLPNQFTIFENVRVFKYNELFNSFSNALKIEGQNGQITFINCQFDGYKKKTSIDPASEVFRYDNWFNVVIEKTQQAINPSSSVVSFLNCTFQDSQYGILINSCENITIDNCWLENLGVAIQIKSDFGISKSINVLNSRFANAAGFGSLEIHSSNFKQNCNCVSVTNSFVSINNNYVVVTNPNSTFYNNSTGFLIAESNSLGGVSMQANSFLVEKLGYTFGVMQTIPVSGTTLNSGNNKIVFINGSSQPVIDIIKSDINAGEYLTIRVQNGSISIKNTENIVFLTTNIYSKFTLINGESATFVKIDNNILESDGVTIKYRGTYQLVSILKTLS